MRTFAEFLRRFEQGIERFLNGDAALWKSGATVQFQYLSCGVSADLAYTVAIERSSVRLVGQKEPAAMSLRVTHLFRKEQGEWKLLHRHADPLMSKTAAVAVLSD